MKQTGNFSHFQFENTQQVSENTEKYDELRFKHGIKDKP